MSALCKLLNFSELSVFVYQTEIKIFILKCFYNCLMKQFMSNMYKSHLGNSSVFLVLQLLHVIDTFL